MINALEKTIKKLSTLMTRPVSSLIFAIMLMLVCFSLCLSSASLVFLHIPTNKNQRLAWHQLEKLRRPENKNATIAIIGDSSAGNAIDANYFSVLTGQKTVSVALTGSFGIPGIVMMLAQAKQNLPKLRYVFFVVAPPTWSVRQQPEAYFLVNEGLSPKYKKAFKADPDYVTAEKGYFNWLFTPRRFLWLWNNIHAGPGKRGLWVEQMDYLEQGPKVPEIKANRLWLKPLPELPDQELPESLRIWSMLCKNIKCILAYGPVYERNQPTFKKSMTEISHTAEQFLGTAVDFDAGEYTVPYSMLGDTRNHILPKYKSESTKHYAGLFLQKTR